MRAATLAASPRQLRGLASAAALACVYFAVAAVSIANFSTNAPIWLGNAIAVAWMIHEPRRLWPAFAAAVWIGSGLAVYFFGGSPYAPLVSLADVGETILAVWLIRRIGGPAAALSSVSGLARFILICVTVTIPSSAWGAAMLWWTEGLPFLADWQKWYAATTLGLLMICPLLLIWRTPELRLRLDQAELRRTLVLASGLMVLAALVFSAGFAATLFILFPAVLLLVWSSGFAGASAATAVLLPVGLWQTLNGQGPIATMVYPATDIVAQIQGLQVYLAALTLASLPLAVVLTDQRRLGAELARVADARGEFLAAMSHEIRTPMTGVLGIVDLLEAENPTPRQQSYLQSIRTSGRHLLSIINDVLDFSRFETGRIELETVDFSLPALLEQLQALLRPLASDRGVSLGFEPSEHSPPVVRGDPTRLRQVLLNLAGNAIKFTPEGRVTVRARHHPLGDGRYRMRFEVEDTGIGIAPDKQKDIFDAFTQGDNSTNRRFGGSGLGLAISKRLVTAMGGSIGVHSKPGEGSCFWFEVTLGAGEAVRVAPDDGSAASAPKPRRILLVEDVELNREIIRSMLERDGHEVAVAENGREAVRLVRGSTFDIVFMDIHMPVMDGIEATRLIRKFSPPKCDIPIVALTANVMAPEQQKCREAGMNDVLMKPVDWDRVRSCLAAVRPSPPPVRQLPFDPATFDKVADVMPPASLASHVGSLAAAVEQLAAATPQDDRQALEAAAHKIVSQAGMLGLQRLSDRAARLEHACREANGIASALDAFAQAAGDIRLVGEVMPEPLAQRSC